MEVTFAFYLQSDGGAGLPFAELGLEEIEGGDGDAVDAIDDVAGLEVDGLGEAFGGAGGDDDAVLVAESGDHFGDCLIDFDAEDAEAGEEVFGGVGEGAEGVEAGAGGDLEREGFIAALDLEGEFFAMRFGVNDAGEAADGVGGLSIDGKEEVADLEAGAVGGAIGFDVGDDGAGGNGEREGGDEGGVKVLEDDADFAAVDVAFGAELLDDIANEGGGDGEAEAFVAAGLRKDERIDADEAAFGIDEGAAAVAGVDGGVGLDVAEGIRVADVAGDGADDAEGDGVAKAKGIADGEDEVALAEAGGGGEGKDGEGPWRRL